MTTMSIEEAQATFAELIHRLAPGEEVVIVDGNQPVACIVSVAPRGARKLGTLQGSVLHIAADSNAPLDDFREYMP